MIKHIINNFALIRVGESYRKVGHCTTYADDMVIIIDFLTEDELNNYINNNNIIIDDDILTDSN
jgi:hypothetical protein